MLGLAKAEYPVIYSDSGLTIVIPTVRKDTEFSLHFVMAWRSLPDPAEISTWIAVDILTRLGEVRHKTPSPYNSHDD